MNVLVITGPIDRTQAGVPEYSPDTKVIDVQLGKDADGNNRVRSFHYASAMQNFLGGKSLRAAVEAKLGPVDKLGVLWFSAGHGAVNVALQTTKPAEVDVWLCLDGLYAGWKHQTEWATRLSEAARIGETTCVATASTSTPGEYADGLTSWRNVVVPTKVPAVNPPAPPPLFPMPAEQWGEGSFVLLGYPKIPHWKQTPAVREGMMRVWTSGLPATDQPPDEEPPEGVPGQPEPMSLWLVAGVVAAVGAAALAAHELWRSKRG